MLGAISYGTVEYAGLLPGGNSPRFSTAGKSLSASVRVGDKNDGTISKESTKATIGE